MRHAWIQKNQTMLNLGGEVPHCKQIKQRDPYQPLPHQPLTILIPHYPENDGFMLPREEISRFLSGETDQPKSRHLRFWNLGVPWWNICMSLLLVVKPHQSTSLPRHTGVFFFSQLAFQYLTWKDEGTIKDHQILEKNLQCERQRPKGRNKQTKRTWKTKIIKGEEKSKSCLWFPQREKIVYPWNKNGKL